MAWSALAREVEAGRAVILDDEERLEREGVADLDARARWARRLTRRGDPRAALMTLTLEPSVTGWGALLDALEPGRAALRLDAASLVAWLEPYLAHWPDGLRWLPERWCADPSALSPLAGLCRSWAVDAGLGVGAIVARLGSAHLARLTTLQLTRVIARREDLVVVEAAARLPRLRHLGLMYAAVGDLLIEALVGVGLPCVRRLDLSCSVGMTARGLARLCEGGLAQALRALVLGGLSLGPAGAEVLASAPSLARLRVLDLSAGLLEDAGVSALAAAPHLRSLRALSLGHDLFSARGLKALLASPLLRGVTRLDLRANALGRRGMRILAASPRLRQLTALNLGLCNLGPGDARRLARVPFEALTHLDLSLCALDDRDAEALARARLDRLEALNLYGNRISAAAGAALRASLPRGCVVALDASDEPLRVIDERRWREEG